MDVFVALFAKTNWLKIKNLALSGNYDYILVKSKGIGDPSLSQKRFILRMKKVKSICWKWKIAFFHGKLIMKSHLRMKLKFKQPQFFMQN